MQGVVFHLIGRFFVGCLVSWLVVPLFAAEAAIIRISEPKLELTLRPGETYSGTINVENPTEEDATVKSYMEDWVYANGAGDKTFSPAGTQPNSMSRWVVHAPMEMVIPPFGRIVARYSITVPEDATGSYFGVMFFESLFGTGVDEEGASVAVSGRIGALFLIEVAGTVRRSGEITDLEIHAPEGNRPLEISYEFANTGNTAVSPLTGTFLIMDPDGVVKARGKLRNLYTLPGDRVRGTTQWVGRLDKGTYDVLFTLNLGKGESIVKEALLTIQ